MHPYHIVDSSPWPLSLAKGIFYFFMGLSSYIHNYGKVLIVLGLITIGLTLYQWFRDVNREALIGNHTGHVVNGLRVGIVLFIISEVLFFTSFFWAFFHYALSPDVSLGSWPPVTPVDPYNVPLLNTILLLSSGCTITVAHISLVSNNWYDMYYSVLITLVLGLVFLLLQFYEYLSCQFSIADSSYGSIFFLATGFHGLHVFLGFVFVFVMFLRHVFSMMTNRRHFGFEASAWYWHFVDVVWLFLYMWIYWWAY